MTLPDDPSVVNPYASPAAVDDELPLQTTDNSRALLQQFRAQMHGLAVLWLLVGVLVSVLGLAFLSGELLAIGETFFRFEGIFVGLAILTAGALWLIAGLITLFKRLWAVYLGLVGSYVALALFVIAGIAWSEVATLVPIMFFGIAIVQSHRLIGWANDLRNRGIPLSARP